MTDKEKTLANLKKNYEEIKKDYNLPEFERLNEDFNIEKLSEVETDNLIREVRRYMGEKFSNYLRFSEALLNPVNVPMFILSVVKTITSEDKKRLTEVYKRLAKIEVMSIELEIEFNDNKEVEFIKDNFEIWQSIKKDLSMFVKTIKESWEEEFKINDKSYFG